MAWQHIPISIMHKQLLPVAALSTPARLAAAAPLSDAAIASSSAWLHDSHLTPLLPHAAPHRQSSRNRCQSVELNAGGAQVCLALLLVVLELGAGKSAGTAEQ